MFSSFHNSGHWKATCVPHDTLHLDAIAGRTAGSTDDSNLFQVAVLADGQPKIAQLFVPFFLRPFLIENHFLIAEKLCSFF